MTKYKSVVAAEDVTPEILEAAESIHDGWYVNEPRIDWTDFLDRLDGMDLPGGLTLDLGDNMLSSAILAIKAHIRRYAKS